MIHAPVTRPEAHIDKYEMKEEVSHSDQIAVKGIVKKLEALDAEFNTYHFMIIDLIEEDELLRELAILDDHDDKIVEHTDHLE